MPIPMFSPDFHLSSIGSTAPLGTAQDDDNALTTNYMAMWLRHWMGRSWISMRTGHVGTWSHDRLCSSVKPRKSLNKLWPAFISHDYGCSLSFPCLDALSNFSVKKPSISPWHHTPLHLSYASSTFWIWVRRLEMHLSEPDLKPPGCLCALGLKNCILIESWQLASKVIMIN